MVQNVENYFEKQTQRKQTLANEGGLTSEKKMLSSYFKTIVHGSKVIRIEIYDASQFSNAEDSLCKCNAELCVQHVVENVYCDNIYTRVRDILKYMDNTVYTSL